MTRFQINPGEFRHIVTLQKRSDNQNNYGEENEWLDVMKARVAIYPISGKELFAAETFGTEMTHKINLRYVPGVTPDMRIKFGHRVFMIESVINFQEKNTLLQLMCKEVV